MVVAQDNYIFQYFYFDVGNIKVDIGEGEEGRRRRTTEDGVRERGR